MTPELVIVKIQSLLSVDNTDNMAQKRAVAMEYCNQCTQANDLLEHCVAMIRAGREYSALEFAESSNLLERINLLSFVEGKMWIDYCTKSGLPSPVPFDENLIDIVSSLYQKGISQTHPLYRDYRRAMRLHDFDKALSVITTISKINSTDTDALNECQRLRKNVVEHKLKRIEQLLKLDSDETNKEFEEICVFLERQTDYVQNSPVWQQALKKRVEVKKLYFNDRARFIIGRIRRLSVDENLDEVVSLLGELNSYSDNLVLSPIDAEFIEDVSKYALKRQSDKLAKEKAMRVSATIVSELENKSAVNDKSRLERLEKLYHTASAGLAPDIAKRLKSKITSVKRIIFLRKFCVGVFSLAIIALLVGIGYFCTINYLENQKRNDFQKRLNAISTYEDLTHRQKAISEIKTDFKDLLDNNAEFKNKVENELNKVNNNLANVNSIKEKIDNLKKFVKAKEFSKFPKQYVEDLQSDIDRLPAKYKNEYSKNLENINKEIVDAVKAKEREIASECESLENDLNDLLSQYKNLYTDIAILDARYKIADDKVKSLADEKDERFRLSNSYKNKYEKLLNDIKEAKGNYKQFNDFRTALYKAKTFDEYLEIANTAQGKDFLPDNFKTKLNKIVKRADDIKYKFAKSISNIEDLASIKNAINIDNLACDYLKLDDLLTNVYAYRQGDKIIYTLGKGDSKEYGDGSVVNVDIILNEISNDGKISKEIHRRREIDGVVVKGKKLDLIGLRAECEFALQVQDIASQKSLLDALEYCRNGKVNPKFLLLLENRLFRKMREEENLYKSGLLYSKSALERERIVRKEVSNIVLHKWIFDDVNDRRVKYLKNEFYSKPSPNYSTEAMLCINSVVLAQKNPLKMIGMVKENANKTIFAEARGIWGVSKSGEFKRMDNDTEDMRSDYAELSPLFGEQKSQQQIKQQVQQMLK